jgi:hypothetical protein
LPTSRYTGLFPRPDDSVLYYLLLPVYPRSYIAATLTHFSLAITCDLPSQPVLALVLLLPLICLIPTTSPCIRLLSSRSSACTRPLRPITYPIRLYICTLINTATLTGVRIKQLPPNPKHFPNSLLTISSSFVCPNYVSANAYLYLRRSPPRPRPYLYPFFLLSSACSFTTSYPPTCFIFLLSFYPIYLPYSAADTFGS